MNMLTYTISKTADNKVFKTVCSVIENKATNCRKEKLLIDVDGTLIQIYLMANRRIKVVNDYEIDCVYVEIT